MRMRIQDIFIFPASLPSRHCTTCCLRLEEDMSLSVFLVLEVTYFVQDGRHEMNKKKRNRIETNNRKRIKEILIFPDFSHHHHFHLPHITSEQTRIRTGKQRYSVHELLNGRPNKISLVQFIHTEFRWVNRDD